MCRFATPITRCVFFIPGEDAEVKLSPTWTRHDNFRYHGNGLENGECGISILNLRAVNNGNATCSLDLNDGLSDVVGQIEIAIARAPQLPEITINNDRGDRLQADDILDADCSARDGRPAATISWFLDERRLPSNDQPEITTSDKDPNELESVRLRLQYRLTPEDNNRMLVCRADHPGYQDGFSETKQQLSVNFHPVKLPEQIVSDLEVGRPAHITISIRSNPRPRLLWTINGKVVKEGQQTDKYIAEEPRSWENSYWNVSLTITELTLEDTTLTYRLRADNEFGSTDYTVRLGPAPDVGGKFIKSEGLISVQF